MTAIRFCNISNFAIYCKITTIYQPLCRNILQKFSRAICDTLQYTVIYCNTIYCSLCIFYIDCRFIFWVSSSYRELFSHYKYIKIETRNRLTPQIFEATTFLKSNKELWENSQQLISRAISMSKMEKFRACKSMEDNEIEEKRMNGDNNS